MMTTKIIKILAVIIFTAGQVHATSIDFYEDGVIQDGDVYDFVTIHDTPPNHTTVNMFGGIVGSSLTSYDSSTINIYVGTISALQVFESSTANLYGGVIDFHLGASSSATVNVYGYGFNVEQLGGTGHMLSGYWDDGSEFSIYLRGTGTYSRVNLIPEPVTLYILAIGGLLIRKHNRYNQIKKK